MMKNLFLTKIRPVLLVVLLAHLIQGCGGAGIENLSTGSDKNAIVPSTDSWIESTVGWSEFSPVKADTSQYSLTDIRQPGSRIFYISSSAGNDDDGEIYFWDGEYIIDSKGSRFDEAGELYGSDPSNPSGQIKAFRNWAYVAPRNDGSDIGTPWTGGMQGAPGAIDASTRYTYPDWWLFKRGDSFDLNADFLEYARRTNPNVSDVRNVNLAVSGGRSASERQIVGAYGPLSKDRPRFVNPPKAFVDRRDNSPTLKNVAYLSLYFDGRGERRGQAIYLYGQNNSSVNILFEDCWFDGTEGAIIQRTSADVTIRRSIITDSWRAANESSHVQGVFFYGNRDAIFRIEESILLRNGFGGGDPSITGWPPTGEQIYNVFNRNLYLSGECDNMNCGIFDSVSMVGASGDQVRPGMRIERNFFYQGYFAMGAHGGYSMDAPTGTIINNVFQRYEGSGTNDNRGQPGWGIELTSGSANVEITGNIVTSAQDAGRGSAYSLRLSALYWFCYNHNFHYPTRNNWIHDNIFDSVAARTAIIVSDGQGESCGYMPPGVTGNRVENNIVINNSDNLYLYERSTASAPASNDTRFTSNKMYRSRQEAALANGWPGSERTLKSYMVDHGYEIGSEDGFIEYFNAATKMRKGKWDSTLTGPAIVKYFREGFGLLSR